ncbi:class I SAM-dependent methyltransferase [Halosolutus gelatinilyticus]|uniref:class I SAM-dependent methyltransferase n=1 Tax=Halosolutus gelatinilyticus TaxID=2931975 RepID=UPI001FF4FE12|nr:class I SAM-dependent methyltransferase [Halosolutus gelatinilyticus]
MGQQNRAADCRVTRLIAAAVGLAIVIVGLRTVRSRRNPSACPYHARLALSLPRPFVTRRRLRRALAPQPGEQILEIGPGIGYYTLDVAEWVTPDGTLDVIDIQRKMLARLEQRATEREITNITAQQGDARRLPYDDDSFDAAYLVTVLGEVPDQDAALRELSRVVKPGGRVVVGETLPDPHMVPFDSLRDRVANAGFEYDRRFGWAGGYVARFRVSS